MDSTYYLLVSMLISNALISTEASTHPPEDTTPDDFKYVVGINCDEKGCSCTGSIINERFVISAAHCFFGDANSYRVVAGVHDVNDTQNPLRVERDVERVYVPSDFNHTCSSDIAVLKLRENLQLEAHKLKYLHLPIKRHSHYNHTGKPVVLAGFGVTKITYTVRRNGTVEEIGYPNTKLHSANVTLVENEKCTNPCVTDSNFCGEMIVQNGAKHYGACGGDSGGPLVYKSKVLFGVRTRGYPGCNERYDFGVYQKVVSYMDFIQKAMRDEVDDLMYKDFSQKL